MKTLSVYLEEMINNDPYVVAVYNDLKIDLGNHAKQRGDTRLSFDKNHLLSIARKIANVFQKSNPDGLFGFYAKEQHISGIFRFFKNTNKIKFVTIFPDKKVQFFNNINGMLVFNEDCGTDKIIEAFEI